MTTRYAYVPAKRGDVGAALTSLFAGMESEDTRYSRSTNYNVIVPLSRRELLDSLEDDIDALSLCHPSRFFVFYLDEALSELEVSVSARCQALSKKEHVCSEVIRIGGSRKQLAALPSLIRANLLTGTPSEFYLYDAGFLVSDLREIASLADTVILDSSDFEGRYQDLAAVRALTKTTLDLQWVALGIWRDEIKDLFGRSIVREYVDSIQSVSITSESSTCRGESAPAVLLGAWIASRLGVSTQVTRAGHRWECTGTSGRAIRLDFTAVSGTGDPGIREVLFKFEPLRIGPVPQEQYIRLSRGEVLSSTVELRVSFRSSRPFDDDTRRGRLLRFFLIGESMANYTASARLAQEFSARGS